MGFLDELHKNMKVRSDERSGATFSYNENLVIIKFFNEGTAHTFTTENFHKLLTFLNFSDIMMGKEKALDGAVKSRD